MLSSNNWLNCTSNCSNVIVFLSTLLIFFLLHIYTCKSQFVNSLQVEGGIVATGVNDFRIPGSAGSLL